MAPESGSTWTVTGTSYLTRLALDADAAVRAPVGRSLTMTVDGTGATSTRRDRDDERS
ncbi:hypothetical protein ACWC2T_32130 [Streptomyces sp. NPDC001393]